MSLNHGTLSGTSTDTTFTDTLHIDNIFENFENFYEEQTFLDIVLIAAIDQTKVKAHRVILAAASDYFMGMFSLPLQESKSDEIQIQNMDGSTLISIVEFIYSGDIVLDVETVENIIRAADFLQMKKLITICCQFMVEHLEEENCLGIAIFAEHHNYTELFEEASSFATKNFSEVCREKEFLKLTADQVMRLISSRDPNDTVPEETVFNSIADWFAHNKSEREGSLFDLLSTIKFDKLTLQFIIANRHRVCTLVECYELLFSWVEWHLSDQETRCQSSQLSAQFINKKKIVVMIPGGVNANDIQIHMFKADLDVWSRPYIPDLEESKKNYSIYANNGGFYLVGGTDDSNHTLATVNHFDTHKEVWWEMPPMLNARHSCGLVELNGELYAVGGICSGVELYSVEKFNFTHRQWQEVAPLRTSIRICEVAVLNGQIYALDVGGYNMQCYDPSTNEWTIKPWRKKLCLYFGVAALGGYLYVIGGHYCQRPSNLVERYNPVDESWSFVTPMDVGRSGVKCVALYNRIIACGGRSESGISQEVDEYNPRTNEWTELSPMFVAINGHAKVVSF